MTNLVIVAIPREDDPVWKYSSEKKPHCTLLFLGEDQSKAMDIAAFLQHAVSITDRGPFGLQVDRRDTLGDDEADVLFFRKDWSTKELASFRTTLLKDKNIRDAYDSVEQFPEWNPHLTMGYPSTPARKDDRDYPGFHWVEFDRIALWTGNYEGPEFRLEYNDYEAEVMMTAAQKAVADVLEHHGVKGMKWGVRRDHREVSTSSSRTVTDKAKVKASGGTGHDAHPDAVKAAVVKQKIAKSGLKAASNKELQDIIERGRLEDQARVAVQGRGKKFIKRKLGQNIDQQSRNFINERVQDLKNK